MSEGGDRAAKKIRFADIMGSGFLMRPTLPWKQHALGPEVGVSEYCVPDGLYFACWIYCTCTSAWEINTANLSVPILTLLSCQVFPPSGYCIAVTDLTFADCLPLAQLSITGIARDLHLLLQSSYRSLGQTYEV